MEQFRHWVVREHGDPQQVMKLEQAVLAPLAAGEARIAVVGVALNFADDLVCRGIYQDRPPFPFTPGFEVSGVVEAVGSPDDQSWVGRRVFVVPKLPRGGMAERITVPVADLLELFAELDLRAASALGAYQTSYAALYLRGGLNAGETLLVHAGAGGVGSAAVQLGKYSGAVVIATAGGPEKVALARRMGADHVIDYTQEDFAARVNALTNGRGADVIFDPVGGDVFDRSRKCIAFEGRLVVVGFASGRIPDVPASHLLVKNYSVCGLHWNLYHKNRLDVVRKVHEMLMQIFRAEKISPLIGAVIPFDEAPAGIASITKRATSGKTVLAVADTEALA